MPVICEMRTVESYEGDYAWKREIADFSKAKRKPAS